ncbi:putative signal transducing protein [Aegicerativicinus sediminis]|uniref:putative signal transducing protein n=1 Tax=Aegicerativicinus sediminis TaxID=2893202 RepID=UPI001E5FEFE6|nr:DUF2007 domain-containing protein [Aegicerativicinus sediminis]
MDHTEFIKVFSGSFIISQLVLERLKEAGIEGIVKDESESGRLAGFGSSIQGFQEIYVHQSELETAKPIVEEIKKDTEVS